MKIRKLCGFDVNGWRDGAARNWVARPGDEEELGVVQVVEGAVLPDVVLTGDGKSARWIGGAQADLAPHGRGGGWGVFGHPDRRHAIRSLMQEESTSPTVLAAAFTGLAEGANFSVASIEDTDRITEPLQDRLFTALSVAKAGKSLLVWRSVLSVLYAIHAETIASAIRDGAVIGIIGHVGDGFCVQTLRIRAERKGDILHLAPERRQVGRLFNSSLGYDGLIDTAKAQILLQAADNRVEHFLSARSIGRLAFGLISKPEPLRRANGEWDVLLPPDQLTLPLEALPNAVASCLVGCDLVLFESLTEGGVRQFIVDLLRDSLPVPFLDLPVSAVAQGALIAAGRHASGQTVYFDFLPRVATIVQGAEGARNYELIDESETLPAGRLYRSPKPARFLLLGGQDRFQVYLRKETHAKPRKALVEVGRQSPEAAPVDLWVEQVPAAGRAKIMMQAPTLSMQFMVDWDAAEVLDQTWEELLDDLATPPPTIPKRLVLPCGMFAWEDSPRGPGLITLLDQNSRKSRPDWEELATKLAARPNGHYCISSDGEIPSEAPAHSVEQLDELTRRALLNLKQMLNGSMEPDTAPLKFLTWQFRRCPREVASLLLDAWEARLLSQPYPLATSSQAWILIRQGLGRIIKSSDHEGAALSLLLKTPRTSWNWRQETAAAAFLLSRSDESPTFLERADVDLLGARVLEEFEASLETEYTRFSYAPFLLVGLLRWRLKSARALVTGHDSLADQLALAVERAMEDMTRRARRLEKMERVAVKWQPLLSAALDELQGSGKNPDLLAAMYEA
ncbi:hypothetical protein [Paracoccus sp. NSM]|uniref:hypothetical protein n=1 Tax=Paracoccus sp. NSM TaxID=3457784 RepID=UPI0040350668